MNIDLKYGDCLEIMPEIESESIDMILCDLPYGTTECKWDTIIPFDRLWAQYERIIKPNGAIVLTASQPFTTDLINSARHLFKYELIWDKTKPSGFVNAKLKPLKQHENILIFSKGVTANGSKRNMNYFPQMRVAEQKNVRPINKGSSLSSAILNIRKNLKVAKSSDDYNPNLRYPYSIVKYGSQVGDCNNSNRLHPTQKPVALFEYLIKTYTNEGDMVLDNCMGSGTTAIACHNLSRHCIGIEKDFGYYEVAKKRLQDVQSVPLLFLV